MVGRSRFFRLTDRSSRLRGTADRNVVDMGSDGTASPRTCSRDVPPSSCNASPIVGRNGRPTGLPQLCDPDMQQRIAQSSQETSYRAYSPDGKVIALANKDGSIELRMLDTGSARLLSERHDNDVYFRFSPNSQFLVSVKGPRKGQKELRIWDVATGDRLHRVEDVSWCTDPVFSPDSTILAAGTKDLAAHRYAIKLFGVGETCEELPPITDNQQVPYFSLAFSNHGDLLAAGSVFGTLTVWHVKSRRQRIVPKQAHAANVYGLAFSPDDTRLASCSWDRSLKLWSVATGDALLTLSCVANMVAFSPDGKTLASASWDGTVRVWRSAGN